MILIKYLAVTLRWHFGTEYLNARMGLFSDIVERSNETQHQAFTCRV